MMLARKVDRLAIALSKTIPSASTTNDIHLIQLWQRLENIAAQCHYDIFDAWAILEQQKDGELNDLEDLCGYLLHVINEMRTVRPRQAAADEQASHEFARSIFQPGGLGDPRPLSPTYDPPHTLSPEDVITAAAPPATLADPLPQEIHAETRRPSTPGTWQESHPHFYKSSSGRQCPSCLSTFVGECNRPGFLECRHCRCQFPYSRDHSAYDEKFPQSMIHRDKNQPEEIIPDNAVPMDHE
jgi:hypothetical protein